MYLALWSATLMLSIGDLAGCGSRSVPAVGRDEDLSKPSPSAESSDPPEESDGEDKGSTSGDMASNKTESESEKDEGARDSDDGDDGDDTNFTNYDHTVPTTCDVWSQDCPEGEKCTLVVTDGSGFWNSNQCVAVVDSPDQVGEACRSQNNRNGVDTCDVRAFCWVGYDAPEENWKSGVCRAFCFGSADDPMCPENTECVQNSSGIPTLCVPRCDPLLGDCTGDELCIINYSYNSFICAPDASNNEHPYGAECQFVNQCNSGLLCIGEQHFQDCIAGGCCTPFCDLNNPIQCEGLSEAPLNCSAIFEEGTALQKYEHVGFCAYTGESETGDTE